MKPCLLLLCLVPLLAQTLVHVDYTCPAEDLESFGLACSEDRPCAVFFEVSAVESFGSRLFVAGDIHTETTTLYGVLLSTDDGGATWSESIPRLRSTAFEQFQIIGDRGWLSGQRLEPLPKDPFLMLTTDGGQSWRQRPLFEETRFGSITQFQFDSATNGELIFDDSVGKAVDQELYSTRTGGESWEIQQKSTKALQLKTTSPSSSWSVSAAPGSGSYLIERVAGGKKEAIARFLIHIGGLQMNAIELELFRHLMVSIAEEMGAVLRKTSYSANIKERRDYSCAVYDAHGETVAMGDHMPVHLGAMPLSVRAVMETFDLGPGDVALVNDPFRGGTHLPDITAVAPVYLKHSKRPAFYLANRAHHADVGGMSPGSMPLAREIYQEGLRMPPVLIQRAGAIDRELLAMILANVRTPEEREGDLRAQLMSIRRGEVRLQELVAKYGAPRVAANMRSLQDYSERMMRAAIARLRPGTYRFEDCLDNDGITEEPVWIRVAITIHGDSATVDFTGSDPQAAGPVNANYAVALAATMYVFRCLIEEEVPYTAGILRPIRVIAPDGSVVAARAPAAMAAGNVETSQRITDTVLGALAKAAPDRIPAASSGTMNNLSFGGAVEGKPFAYYETIAGGMGASPRGNGYSATHTHMTNSWNTPIEAFEHQYPLRIESYRIRKGSGGAGKHRGGDGIVREFRFLADAEVTILSDRRERGPYGLAGGSAGKPGKNTLLRGGRAFELEAKTRFEIHAGDVLRIESPGGGGWGPELEDRP